MMKLKNSKVMRDDKAKLSALEIFLLGILVVIVVSFGAGTLYHGIENKAQSVTGQAGTGFNFNTPAPQSVAAPGLPTDPAAQAAYDNSLNQGVTWSPTAQDTAGNTVTTAAVVAYYPDQLPHLTNAKSFAAVNPGSSNTGYAVRAGGIYSVDYMDTGNTYYPASLCDPINPTTHQIPKTFTACQISTMPNDRIQHPDYGPKFTLYKVGAFVDPLDESSTTDSQGINAINSQTNITVPEGAQVSTDTTRCIVSSTAAAGTQFTAATAGTSAPANGNILFVNDSICAGTWTTRVKLECSTTINAWCHEPVLSVSDPNTNITGLPFTGVSISLDTGPAFSINGQSSLLSLFNNMQSPNAFPLYPLNDVMVPSNSITYATLTWHYDNTVFAKGQCFIVWFDDNGGHGEWLGNSTLNGGAAQHIEFCRAN